MNVQPGGFISQIDQDVPQRQTILTPGHAHQDSIMASKHMVFLNGAGDLIGEVLLETRLTEGGVVAPNVYSCLVTTLDTLHRCTLLRSPG